MDAPSPFFIFDSHAWPPPLAAVVAGEEEKALVARVCGGPPEPP
jgi:hypothetical protein